jgi:inosine-uridine nucleoside N-ribohydrolase
MLLVGIEFNFAVDPLAASRVLEEFQTTIRIVTFELTCMSTIPYEMVESEMLSLKENPNNSKARLFAEVSQFLIDFCKTEETNPELFGDGLVSCDAVCMACVLNESIIQEKKSIYACVEPFGKYASGHMISDWYGHFKRQPNVEIITNMNQEKYLEMFKLCVKE